MGILILEQDFLIGVWRYSSQIHPMCYKRIFLSSGVVLGYLSAIRSNVLVHIGTFEQEHTLDKKRGYSCAELTPR